MDRILMNAPKERFQLPGLHQTTIRIWIWTPVIVHYLWCRLQTAIYWTVSSRGLKWVNGSMRKMDEHCQYSMNEKKGKKKKEQIQKQFREQDTSV